MKKTKRGESEVDICTFIRSLEVSALPDGVLIDCVLAAGNDNLNPEYLTRALDEYTPCDPYEYTRPISSTLRAGVTRKAHKKKNPFDCQENIDSRAM